MQLLYSPASPYARKVRILLRMFKVLEQTKEIETSPLDNDPKLLELNPLGKIPCLITAEGLPLYDSQVICRYLDETYNEGNLHPSGSDRWSGERDLSLIQGILDEAVFVTIEKRRDKALQSDFWRERYQTAILRSLEAITPRITAMVRQ